MLVYSDDSVPTPSLWAYEVHIGTGRSWLGRAHWTERGLEAAAHTSEHD